MWAVFAFGSAVFAALTSVLAKIGINGVQSNLATALRTRVCQPQKLAVFGSFRPGNRRVVALLLPGAAAWRGVESCFH